MNVVEGATDKAPTGYILSAVGGCLALTFTVFVLGAIWESSRGHNPLDVFNGVGVAGFVFSYAPIFIMRLIFWPKASVVWKSAARLFMTAFFAASLMATVVALVLLAGPAGLKAGGMTYWMALAALCQVGAVVWLVRYRRV